MPGKDAQLFRSVAPYGGSKAALASLTDALRAEIEGTGVIVSLIEPGAVRTQILTASRARGVALLDRLLDEVAKRYRGPLLATFAQSEKAFRRAISPETLAQLILRILTTSNPKPRYLVGREALGLGFLSMLPASPRAKLLARTGRAGNQGTC